jgi:hypothetical protein
MSFAIQNNISYLNDRLFSISPSNNVYNIGDIVYPRTSNYSAIFNIDNSSGPIVWNLSVDKNLATVGDILNIMLVVSNPGLNLVTLNLSSDFYTTVCGNEKSSLSVGEYARLVLVFTYDGNAYISTYDNC